MNRLDPNNRLFTNLEKENPTWWQALVAEKDIYIDIRKDNYIDIYYNGGNIISELRHNGTEFTGKIHYKYLLPEEAEYIDYDFSKNTTSLLKKNSISLFNLNSFDANALKRIKANISGSYPAKSEKGIQARFVTNTKQFLDSEFAHNTDDNLRIDLIWIDKNEKKIVPVELKTMGDSRLYTDEIIEQLEKYKKFVENNEIDLLAYYKKLFLLKKRLKILSDELNVIDSLDNYSMQQKPLLLFGDCKQDWIDNNCAMLDSKIKAIAYGTYYYGSPDISCNLNQRKHKNRHIY